MRALVVDDEPAVLNLMVRWLQDAGWTVDAVQTFRDARHALGRRPDLMVADIRLGDFNGLQLAMLAREVDPNVRVVMISGFDDPVIRRDAAILGAEFVVKPFSNGEFLAAVAHDTESLRTIA